MVDTNVINSHPPEFDQFLYASVGEDRNGYAVTVLSTLARLGLDPWNETADLVTLGRAAARSRLETLLARFRDVPALVADHGKVARDLIQLLPEGRPSRTLGRVYLTVSNGQLGRAGAIWTILAISLLLFQLLVVAGSGLSE